MTKREARSDLLRHIDRCKAGPPTSVLSRSNGAFTGDIAVASVGFLMLTGRINWRCGATVIIGCFILFGTASIVAGIQSTAALGH
jgi:type IV secretory pathway VirB2 component (pilin)